jgi:hypothetical protein
MEPGLTGEVDARRAQTLGASPPATSSWQGRTHRVACAESARLLDCFVGDKAGAQAYRTGDVVGAPPFAVEDADLEQYAYLASNHKN